METSSKMTSLLDRADLQTSSEVNMHFFEFRNTTAAAAPWFSFTSFRVKQLHYLQLLSMSSD